MIHARTKTIAGWLAVALVATVFAVQARAELRIDITQGNAEPLPIAVSDFQGTSPDEARFGRDIAGVVSADLVRSGLFKAVDHAAFVQTDLTMEALPRFPDWRVINAQALVHGRTLYTGDGRLKVEFRLWDVFAEQQMAGWAFQTVPGNWRRVAHIIADAVYKRVTGEDGYFDTRIVYVAESGPANRRVKRLAVMDQDGANHEFLTNGSHLVLTPRFSPTMQEITYLSYFGNVPRVYLFNLDTGRHEVLGEFPGMTFAPRFSPDGAKVIMSMAKDGNSDIFTMDLRTRAVKQLTTHSAIDTSPCYSPDGTKITFNSDRGGSQQIYVMDADGGNVQRISHGKGRYATPVWSPRGDMIAFTKIGSNGRFNIGVMRIDGTGERLLAEAFLVEAPTWSPNGRVLMFFREEPLPSGEGVSSRLYSIDLTGHNEREIVTPMDGSDPAWSPLIP